MRPEFERVKGNADARPNTWYSANGFVIIHCSNNHPSALLRPNSPTNHGVSSDGMVQPSVVCMWPDCDFHEFIKLKDYEAPKTKSSRQ